MSDLLYNDKKFLESIFFQNDESILDLSNEEFSEFIKKIKAEKFNKPGMSSADILRYIWADGSNNICGESVLLLVVYLRSKKIFSKKIKISEASLKRAEKIGEKLKKSTKLRKIVTQVLKDLPENGLHLEIQPEIYMHIKKYIDDKDYYHAVEESYKIVREKLRKITTKEKAIDVFNPNAESIKYYNQLFGHIPETGTPEANFFRGVGYLNLAVQFLRNEKAHSLATDLNENIAIHYISLASLAFDLISRNNTNE
ncbi:MAG TPA: TIGR02391 family protein [Alphaproteobacteria bacterium]|nr:TIGR02391 family protein [Alphaproteobacteria bacterium]